MFLLAEPGSGGQAHPCRKPPKPHWITIVGVIADARTESLADAGIPQMYLDIYQRPAKFLAVYLRGLVDPAAISAQVRTQVQAVDPELSRLPRGDLAGFSAT